MQHVYYIIRMCHTITLTWNKRVPTYDRHAPLTHMVHTVYYDMYAVANF